MGKRKRKNFQEVQKSFEEVGYKLVSTEYFNSKSKLEYLCLNGHNRKISYSDFCSGRRCIKCYHEKNRQKN